MDQGMEQPCRCCQRLAKWLDLLIDQPWNLVSSAGVLVSVRAGQFVIVQQKQQLAQFLGDHWVDFRLALERKINCDGLLQIDSINDCD